MATLTVQNVGQTGLALTPALVTAGALGDEYTNDPNTILYVKNTHTSSSSTITITAQRSSVSVSGYGSLSISNISYMLTALNEMVIHVPISSYNDANGRVQFTCTINASVKVAALRLVEN